MPRNVLAAASLTAFVYIICFQLFLSSGYYAFLYAGNITFFIAVAVFTFSKHASVPSQFFPLLTGKGIRFSFTASLFSLAGCFILSLVNFYFFPELKSAPDYFFKSNQHPAIGNANWVIGLAIVNAFIANMVAGGLASFFTAGIANEKNYQQNSTVLPSVKH